MKPFAKILFCSTGFLLLFFSTARAQSTPAQSDILKQLLPSTAILVRIDLSRVSLPIDPDANKKGQAENEMAKQIETFNQQLQPLKSILGDQPIYGLVDLPYSFAQPPVRVFFGDLSTDKQQKLSEWLAPFELRPLQKDDWSSVCLPILWKDRVALFSPRFEDGDPIQTPKNLPIPVGRFVTALEAVEKFPIQVAIVPPDYLWRAYDELLTELPERLGGGPPSRLTQGLRWMAVGIDPATMEMKATVQSTSPDAAHAFAPFLPELLNGVMELFPQPFPARGQEISEKLATQVQVRVIENRIEYTLESASNPHEAKVQFLKLFESLLESKSERQVKPKLQN